MTHSHQSRTRARTQVSWLPAQCSPHHSFGGQGRNTAPRPWSRSPPPPAALQPVLKMASRGWMEVVAKREHAWNNMTFRNLNQLALSVLPSSLPHYPHPQHPTPHQAPSLSYRNTRPGHPTGSGTSRGPPTWKGGWSLRCEQRPGLQAKCCPFLLCDFGPGAVPLWASALGCSLSVLSVPLGCHVRNDPARLTLS